MSENAPSAPQLKERSELTESDLVAVETADGRLVVAYLIGQHGGFMYIIDELSLNSADLTNVSSTSLVPELIFYSAGMRAVNVQSVRSFFRPSPLLRLLYHETLNRLMDSAKKVAEKMTEESSPPTEPEDIDSLFPDVFQNTTIH